MHADLDTLCTVVYCTADDLLPERKRNARRRTTDAEIVTLAVAQVLMGIPRTAASFGRPVDRSVISFPNFRPTRLPQAAGPPLGSHRVALRRLLL